MLTAIGDLVEDVVVLLSGPPNTGSDVDARISRHRGGSAANVAAAAAAATGRARFVGQVGDDDLGDRLLDRLRGTGVDTAVRRGGRTGTIVALVAPDGERTMLSDRGASTELADVDPAWLEDTTVLHVPAYSLAAEPLATSARTLVGVARDRDVPVSVDTSSVAVLEGLGIERFRDTLAELAVDVVVANAAEARLLELQARPVRGALLVIKQGAEPTLILRPDGRRQEVAVPAAGVVDTTGAGDAFAAGLLTAWVGGEDAVGAVRAGHLLAGQVIGHPGAELPR